MLLMPLEANDSSPAMVKPGTACLNQPGLSCIGRNLLVLLQSALQLLVALAQPRMLPLLRVKLLHGQSHFRGVPAAHTRRSGLIR